MRADLFTRYCVEIDRVAIRELMARADNATADKADAKADDKADAKPQQ